MILEQNFAHQGDKIHHNLTNLYISIWNFDRLNHLLTCENSNLSANVQYSKCFYS